MVFKHFFVTDYCYFFLYYIQFFPSFSKILVSFLSFSSLADKETFVIILVYRSL